MLSKSIIIQRLQENPNEVSEDHFLKMHIAVEGYLKWLFLVGLRINGCTYSSAAKVIQRHFIRLNTKSFKAAFRLLGVKKSWHQIKTNDPNLKTLEYLCFNYTSPIRNQLVHGNYYDFKERECELAYQMNKAFIQQLEKTIQVYKNGNAILQNTPTQFGAKKGTIADEIAIGRILNQSPGLKPMRFEEAKKRFIE